ncbi:AroM family protein [Pandoraea terrae]|nr:AroM family protein [Pandoraea terrae]
MNKLGTLTIGQAPRSDIVPILEAHLPPGLPVVHAGVLDGLDRAGIEAAFAPQPGNATLISRMLTGDSVVLDKPAVRRVMQAKLDALEAQGCSVILVLCTGEFHGLACQRAWLVEPDRIVPPAAAALAGERQVGIVVPLAEQIESEFRKWSALQRPPICAAASPYSQDEAALAHAARELRDRGADMLILDCMGFVERHRDIARDASGLPVVLSNALIARLTAALV